MKNKRDNKGTKKMQVRNAVRTKARILEKSTVLFAEAGFNGTPISDLIQASGVNKRMIYHYFGDKKGLYRAIFVKQWGELKEWFDRVVQKRLEEGGSNPLDGRSLLKDAASTFFDFMATHQTFVRLLMWEGLEGGEISRSIWTDVRGPIYVQIEFLVKQAQGEGTLDPKLDPAHLVASFLGLISFYFAYGSTLTEMIRKDPFSPEALTERKKQVLHLLESLFRRV